MKKLSALKTALERREFLNKARSVSLAAVEKSQVDNEKNVYVEKIIG